VIPFSLGHESRRLLVSKGYDVEWRTYPTGHTLRRRQLADVADGGLSEGEFERAKGHMKGSLVLSLEDPGGRMSRLGKSEISHGEILTVSQILQRIEAVTLDDARRVAKRVLSQPTALAVLGPFAKGALA